jgi:hypothetical protein
LADKYGAESVYIVTSDKQAPVSSPFSYPDKVEMMTKLGVPASHIVKVKNPYQAKEITDNLTPEERADTVLIFAVSVKDAERFNFKPKKDGSASYMQPLPEYPGQQTSQKKLKPMTKAAYIDITPTVNFKVRGQDANSATVVRQLFIDGNDQDRDQIITDLYGAPDSSLRDMFKQRLGITDHVVKMMQECRRIGTARSMALMERIIRAERAVLREFAPTEPRDDDGDVPPDIYTLANRWWNNTDDQDRIATVLRSRGWDIQQADGEEDVCQLTYRDGSVYYLNDGEFDPELFEDPDYINEKWSQKYKRSIDCSHPKGFSQRAHCAGRKK